MIAPLGLVCASEPEHSTHAVMLAASAVYANCSDLLGHRSPQTFRAGTMNILWQLWDVSFINQAAIPDCMLTSAAVT